MTPTQRKAIEDARNALQRAGYPTDRPDILELCEQADEALRAALAEPAEYTVEVNGKRSAVLTALMNSRTKAEPVSEGPLTDSAIDNLAAQCVKGNKSVQWALREIERAHGIGGDE